MPFINVWLHFVWGTKNRYPFLNDEIRNIVFDHIMENARQKGIFIDCVNGHVDHAHCLISLSTDQTISKVMQLLKGESSFWINRQNLCQEKFEWQDDYFVESVSPSDLQKLRAYIHGQERHHKKVSFREEYEELIKKFQFK